MITTQLSDNLEKRALTAHAVGDRLSNKNKYLYAQLSFKENSWREKKRHFLPLLVWLALDPIYR